MIGKDNWDETRQKWTNYWRRENVGRPLMCVIARDPSVEASYQQAVKDGSSPFSVLCQGTDSALPQDLVPRDVEDLYQNAARMDLRYRHFCQTHHFLGESFPNIDADFGPGSMAGYLGSNIVFRDDTVWFEPCIDDWAKQPPLAFDADNTWWKKHYELVRELSRLSGGDYLIGMPDIMENVDVLASLRGVENSLYDIIDEEDEVIRRVGEVGAVYYEYYDRFYEYLKTPEGGSAYTVFQIWGPGRVAKLQCDLSAMLSPDNFRTLILDSLRTQAQKLDQVLYHLDGAEAIRHLDAIMEIDEIDALQWTSGDWGPDGTLEDWDVIYDKARAAGKSLWVKVYTGEIDDWIRNVDRLVQKYGSHSLFLHFPEMSMADAERLLGHADKHWSDVQGTFRP
jgi:5-methyltetrahydrofolate--homocysteine methyltransferase